MKQGRRRRAMPCGGRRTAPGTRRTPRGGTDRTPRMVVQVIVCGALFVALVGLKLIMPDHLSSLRGTLGQWLVRDADFVSAFSAVGRAASGEQTWGDSLSEACIAVFGGEKRAQEVSGELIGVTVPEQDAPEMADARELPALAVGEQRILGFAYACPLSGTLTSPFGWREKYVTVNHEGGFSTLYAHCSAVTVSAGQSVRKGDELAHVGSTGNATGPHLHFEVHDGGEYLNPIYYVVS